MGFFWGVDQDSIVDLLKKLFFDKVRTQKPGKSSLSVLVHGLNRLGVVELVGREPLIIARVENGVTTFSPQRQKITTPEFSKKNGSGKQFLVGNFLFFGRGKTNFFWGGYNFKTG